MFLSNRKNALTYPIHAPPAGGASICFSSELSLDVLKSIIGLSISLSPLEGIQLLECRGEEAMGTSLAALRSLLE